MENGSKLGETVKSKRRLVPVDSINPAPYNPRRQLRPGDVEYEKLKKSIEEFGLVEDLVWNERTGTLVGGPPTSFCFTGEGRQDDRGQRGRPGPFARNYWVIL